MSFVYAKLLVVVCIAYVFSDAVTHNIPLYYYEGFFTYLYGMSILFLLYVFCFLLQESSCCAGAEKEKKVSAQGSLKVPERWAIRLIAGETTAQNQNQREGQGGEEGRGEEKEGG